MDVLKKCKKAEIYTLADEAICEAEVFRDMADELWLSIPGDVTLETSEFYTIVFFDSVSGLMRCHCSVGEAQPISDERNSVPCKPQFGHGCQFIEMRPQTEAVLRNYIFRQERNSRR